MPAGRHDARASRSLIAAHPSRRHVVWDQFSTPIQIKGYEMFVVQDLVLRAQVTRYRWERRTGRPWSRRCRTASPAISGRRCAASCRYNTIRGR
jgi:hypothetical protein